MIFSSNFCEFSLSLTCLQKYHFVFFSILAYNPGRSPLLHQMPYWPLELQISCLPADCLPSLSTSPTYPQVPLPPCHSSQSHISSGGPLLDQSTPAIRTSGMPHIPILSPLSQYLPSLPLICPSPPCHHIPALNSSEGLLVDQRSHLLPELQVGCQPTDLLHYLYVP